MSNAQGSLKLTDKFEFQEMLKIYMDSASESISSILKSKVEISIPEIKEMRLNEVEYSILEPVIFVKSSLISNTTGSLLLIFRQRDVQLFLNELMGVDDLPEPDFEFDEVALSATNEIMNQMIRTSASAMSEYLGSSMRASDSQTFVAENGKSLADNFSEKEEDKVAVITYKLMIKDMIESEFMQVLSNAALENLNTGVEAREEKLKSDVIDSVKATAEDGSTLMGTQRQSVILGQRTLAYTQAQKSDQRQNQETPYQSNIELIMDVPLSVSVEIGKTRRKLKDVLGFNNGTVVELEKQADAPADIIVNGQLIARGEVLVIDDNFGVRITEIINTKNIIGNGELN